jgi:hypothetical protein
MNPIEPKHNDASGDRLERALRAALRPVDPGPAFTAALQARLLAAASRPQGALLRPITMPRPAPQAVPGVAGGGSFKHRSEIHEPNIAA